MTASSLLDQVAAFECGASTIKGCRQEFSGGFNTMQVRVDLIELALGKLPPVLASSIALDELTDLTNCAADFLKERDRCESLKHGWTIVTTPPNACLRPDEARLFVIPQGGALEP